MLIDVNELGETSCSLFEGEIYRCKEILSSFWNEKDNT